MIHTKWIKPIGRPKSFKRKPYEAYGVPDRRTFIDLLEELDNNKEALAKLLGVTSWTINKWMKHYSYSSGIRHCQ